VFDPKEELYEMQYPMAGNNPIYKYAFDKRMKASLLLQSKQIPIEFVHTKICDYNAKYSITPYVLLCGKNEKNKKVYTYRYDNMVF
jgi:hypothetical protein